MARQAVIAVAIYSTYGHITTMAEAVIKGVEASGAIVKPYFIKETLPEEVLTKMHAGGSLSPKYPTLTANDLKEVDGVIFGFPTRYGRAPAQVSAFFDSCGQLWATGALVGKFASVFTSTASLHGGQETTALTTMPFFAHQGMVYVPIGYVHKYLVDLESAHGASAYGASTIAAGDGSRQPTTQELDVAEYQGKYFADFVATHVRGMQAASHSTAAASSTSAPAAAKEVPQAVGGDSQGEGYKVAGEPVPAAATSPAPATAPTTIAASPATPATPAVAVPAPATKEAHTHAAATAPQKKKGGLFASCCGGRGIED